MSAPRERTIEWQATDDEAHPFAATVDGTRWSVRVNRAPGRPSTYALLVDGHVVEEFDEWPAAWARPAGTDPYEQREFELEGQKFERTKRIGPSKLVK